MNGMTLRMMCDALINLMFETNSVQGSYLVRGKADRDLKNLQHINHKINRNAK